MNSSKRKKNQRVAVVTGTRADYGLLKPVMVAIDEHKRLDLRLIVTGMHLIKKFGYTVKEIENDGWSLDARIKMQSGQDSGMNQARGLSRGVSGIAEYLDAAGVDVVVVLGDRIEAMAGALAAVTTGKLLVHIHGGDVAQGDFDENLRHAITKLAHVHCAATAMSKKRIIQMGEEPRRVHFVGAPGLDDLRRINVRILAQRERARRDVMASKSVLVVQHPTGRPAKLERQAMDMILRSVDKFDLSPVIVYPNSDRGHTGIVEAIKCYRPKCRDNDVSVHRSMPRLAYLTALSKASAIIGNSSSGIIEAGLAGTPAVNVGDRQRGREHNGPAVFDAKETARSIEVALGRALNTRPIKSQACVYGRKPVGPRIAAIIASVPQDEGFVKKSFVDVDVNPRG